MQVTCSCGKKLIFGDDPNEVHVCNFCGQTVTPAGPVADKSARGKRGSGFRRAVSDDEDASPPPPRRPRGDPPISAREKLYIASANQSGKGKGCVIALLVAVAAAFAIDYFVVNPVRTLPCGHEGKEAYLFGILPVGHTCPGLEVIRYMDRLRRSMPDPTIARVDIDTLKEQAGVGDPPAPYDCDVLDDGSLRCWPTDDSGLTVYTMSFGGEVTPEESE